MVGRCLGVVIFILTRGAIISKCSFDSGGIIDIIFDEMVFSTFCSNWYKEMTNAFLVPNKHLVNILLKYSKIIPKHATTPWHHWHLIATWQAIKMSTVHDLKNTWSPTGPGDSFLCESHLFGGSQGGDGFGVFTVWKSCRLKNPVGNPNISP